MNELVSVEVFARLWGQYVDAATRLQSARKTVERAESAFTVAYDAYCASVRLRDYQSAVDALKSEGSALPEMAAEAYYSAYIACGVAYTEHNEAIDGLRAAGEALQTASDTVFLTQNGISGYSGLGDSQQSS